MRLLRCRPSTAPVVVALALQTACAAAGGTASALPSDPPPPTATAFLPAPPSPTPAIAHLWVSPAVPDRIRHAVEEANRGLGSTVVPVTSEEQADARLTPGGASPLGTWTYAVAAPFPTVRDGIGLSDLRALWGAAEGGEPIFASPATAEAMRTLLGDPGANVRRIADPEKLVADAWQSRPSLAILPFEDLEPRWKVLELDGQSPIRNDFDASTYPLQVHYGFDGGSLPPEWREGLEHAAGMPLPLANRRDDRMTTVVMTGVTALTRATAWEMERSGVTRPARDIGGWLREADVTHISHEVAFSPECPPPEPDLTALLFCAQPGHLALLEDVGTDVIELTGNHVLDAGQEALLYTLNLYDSEGWETFGGGANLEEAREPVRIEHNGNRIAFVGCNEAGPTGSWATPELAGSNPCGADRLVEQVRALRDEGYMPIFTFQWHENYVPSATTSQREAFRAAAEAGAVAVSGSQAHQPQSFEFDDGAFIHYGLGNLFFDQMWAEAVRREFIDRYVFHDGRLISVELLTAYLEDWSRPRPMTPEERAAFLEEMFSASGW